MSYALNAIFTVLAVILCAQSVPSGPFCQCALGTKLVTRGQQHAQATSQKSHNDWVSLLSRIERYRGYCVIVFTSFQSSSIGALLGNGTSPRHATEPVSHKGEHLQTWQSSRLQVKEDIAHSQSAPDGIQGLCFYLKSIRDSRQLLYCCRSSFGPGLLQ